VSILNPTGGLVGGDRLDVTIDVGPGAHACLTTPSATKVYRTTGAMAEQHVSIVVDAGAMCEWIPDHTIPFPGSRLRQTLDARLAEGATVAAAPLPRRGAIGRVLAADAPAFVAALEAVWTVARLRLLDAPALALRKP